MSTTLMKLLVLVRVSAIGNHHVACLRSAALGLASARVLQFLTHLSVHSSHTLSVVGLKWACRYTCEVVTTGVKRRSMEVEMMHDHM